MAKFGRGFVNAATNPAFLGGMMNAFGQIGATPRRRREEEEQTRLAQGLFGLEEAVRQKKISPELYQTMRSGYAGKMDAKNEKYMAGRLKEIDALQQGQTNRQAAGEIARLSGEITKLELDNTVAPLDKQAQLEQIQTQLSQLIEGSTLDPNILMQIVPNAQKNALDIQSKRQNLKRLDDAVENLSFNEEEREYTRKMWAQNLENGQLRADMGAMDKIIKGHNVLVTQAKQMTKEQFVKAHPDKARVWDAVQRDTQADQLRIQDLQQKVDDGQFKIEEDTLAKLGFSADTISGMLQLAKSDPRMAKARLKTLLTTITPSKKPSAALAEQFADVALGNVLQVEGISSSSDSWIDKFGKPRATNLALKAADVYINQGGSLDQAMAVIYSYQPMGRKAGDVVLNTDEPAPTPEERTLYFRERIHGK